MSSEHDPAGPEGVRTRLLLRRLRHVLRFNLEPAPVRTPRVTADCKHNGVSTHGVSTHDALLSSARAMTHKQVHPYLRFGVLVGGLGSGLPTRLVGHGANLDFMAAWSQEEPDAWEWSQFVRVVKEEVLASRRMQALLRSQGAGEPVAFLHRPLVTCERESPPAPRIDVEDHSPDLAGPGPRFYVYENWVHDYAKVHSGDCVFCRNGEGFHQGRTDDNSQWLGPFPTLEGAYAAARGTGRGLVEACRASGPCSRLHEQRLPG